MSRVAVADAFPGGMLFQAVKDYENYIARLHARIRATGQVGNKFLISRTVFNDWLAGHTIQPPQSVTVGVKSRKLRGKWYPVVGYRCGKRETRVIGTDRKIAEEARRSSRER